MHIKTIGKFDFNLSYFKSLSFSDDGQKIIALGQLEDPDVEQTKSYIVLANWSRGRTTNQFTVDCELSYVCFNPGDSSVITAMGPKDIRMWKYLDGFRELTIVNITAIFDPTILNDDTTLVNFQYVNKDDAIVLATSNGDLFFMDGFEIRGKLSVDYAQKVKNMSDDVTAPPQINCIVGTKQGFFAAGSNGIISNYVVDARLMRQLKVTKARAHGLGNTANYLASEGFPFRRQNVWRDKNKMSFVHGCVSVDDSFLILQTSDGQLVKFDMATAMLFSDELTKTKPSVGQAQTQNVDSQATTLSSNYRLFSHVLCNFPIGELLSCSLCTRRPIFATVSTDKTIRLYNYQTRKTEVIAQFFEDCYSVVLHPTGYYIAGGFSDRTRIFTIVADHLEVVAELPQKGITTMKFSNGGDVLAIVEGSNIFLYDFYSTKLLAKISLHISPIRDISFSYNDSLLTSVDKDGSLYVWDLRDFSRVGENAIKHCRYSAVAMALQSVVLSDSSNYDTEVIRKMSIIAAGSHHRIRVLQSNLTDKQGNRISASDLFSSDTFEVAVGPVDITVLAMPFLTKSGTISAQDARSFLFLASTSQGAIRLYHFPPIAGETEDEVLSPVFERFCHAGSITSMEISSDDNLVLSVGTDGVIFLHHLYGSRSHLEELGRNDIVTHLAATSGKSWDYKLFNQNEVAKFEAQIDLSTRRLEEEKLKHSQALHELEASHMSKLDSEKGKLQTIINENVKIHETTRKTMERNLSELQREVEQQSLTHQKDIATLTANHQRAITDLNNKLSELQDAKEDQEIAYQENLDRIRSKFNDTVSNIKLENKLALDQKDVKIAQLKVSNKDEQRAHELNREQIEDEYSTMLHHSQKELNEQLARSKQTFHHLKSEHDDLKQQFKTFQKTANAKDVLISQKQNTVLKLKSDVNDKNTKLGLLRTELEDRNKSIAEKEKQIFELKNRNQELEKFKNVLGIKIRDLKSQIEPRDLQIKEMKAKIFQMDDIMEKDHQNQSNLKLNISALLKKNDLLKSNLKKMEHVLETRNGLIKSFQKDLFTMVNQLEISQWPECVRELYRSYCEQLPSNLTKDNIDVDSEIDILEERQEKSKIIELQRQRVHLQNKCDSLKRKLEMIEKSTSAHHQQQLKQNKALIQEINTLRVAHRELKLDRDRLQNELRTAQAHLRERIEEITRLTNQARHNQEDVINDRRARFRPDSTNSFGGSSSPQPVQQFFSTPKKNRTNPYQAVKKGTSLTQTWK
eukprot:TRINITY_DN60_c0_g1_i1.p1 TRINITY_DN60_c0_g1~~TRINITY_DN60_c0_g1_i1.p1  ORF type:complete len:1367 (-),score=315.13 TRINITY_DN60_c0_g1_i1:92-3841(-)